MLFILLTILQARADLANMLFKADMLFRTGNITGTQQIYDDLFSQWSDAELYQMRYSKYLLSVGNFEKIISTFGSSKYTSVQEEVKKAKLYLSYVKSANSKKMYEIREETPCSKDVLSGTIKYLFKICEYKEAMSWIERALNLFSTDPGFKRQEAQCYCLIGNYSVGINKLRSLGINVRQISENLNIYEEILGHNKRSRLLELNSFYDKLTGELLLDNFSPSLYTNLQFKVLYKVCSLGIEMEAAGLSNRCLQLWNKNKDEESLYFYVMALLADGKISTAEKLKIDIKSAVYKSRINRKLADIDAEEKRRKQQRQRSYSDKRAQEAFIPESNKKGTDFLGYYKDLGVKYGASIADVKKGYVKEVKKLNVKLRKDEKKLEEGMLRLNKAKTSLSDQEKRELYHAGIDPDKPHQHIPAQRHAQQFDFEDLFGSFFGNGGFNQGFQNFRQSRGGTQYFYFNG